MNEIDTTKKMIKFLEKSYGTKLCKEYRPGCINCQGGIIIGLLKDHLELLKYDEDQATE